MLKLCLRLWKKSNPQYKHAEIPAHYHRNTLIGARRAACPCGEQSLSLNVDRTKENFCGYQESIHLASFSKQQQCCWAEGECTSLRTSPGPTTPHPWPRKLTNDSTPLQDGCKTLHGIVRAAEKIGRTPLPFLQNIYSTHLTWTRTSD